MQTPNGLAEILWKLTVTPGLGLRDKKFTSTAGLPVIQNGWNPSGMSGSVHLPGKYWEESLDNPFPE